MLTNQKIKKKPSLFILATITLCALIAAVILFGHFSLQKNAAQTAFPTDEQQALVAQEDDEHGIPGPLVQKNGCA